MFWALPLITSAMTIPSRPARNTIALPRRGAAFSASKEPQPASSTIISMIRVRPNCEMPQWSSNFGRRVVSDRKTQPWAK